MSAPIINRANLPAENNAKSRLLNNVIPLAGCVSYELFSANILVHNQFSKYLGQKDVITADILWLNAHIGVGIYLYKQRQFQKTSTPWRIVYSAFGSAMFNFSSVLLWGATRNILAKTSETQRFLFGLGSGLGLLFIGWHYLDFVDKVLMESEDTQNEGARTEQNNGNINGL